MSRPADPPSRAPAGPVLSLSGLAKAYGGAAAHALFRDVDLELEPGAYVAIRGESGVGKSTLLNLIAGLDRPDAGRVRVDGVDLAALDDDARTLVRRSRMGFVFQAFHLLPHLTVAQNTALPLRIAGKTAAESARRALAVLASVGLAALAGRYPRALSGGEIQRVAIARALVHEPRLVLADEPTGNLDAETAGTVLALLRDAVKRGGGAGILVTHSARAAATADRTYVLTARGLTLQDAA